MNAFLRWLGGSPQETCEPAHIAQWRRWGKPPPAAGAQVSHRSGNPRAVVRFLGGQVEQGASSYLALLTCADAPPRADAQVCVARLSGEVDGESPTYLALCVGVPERTHKGLVDARGTPLAPERGSVELGGSRARAVGAPRARAGEPELDVARPSGAALLWSGPPYSPYTARARAQEQYVLPEWPSVRPRRVRPGQLDEVSSCAPECAQRSRSPEAGPRKVT